MLVFYVTSYYVPLYAGASVDTKSDTIQIRLKLINGALIVRFLFLHLAFVFYFTAGEERTALESFCHTRLQTRLMNH